MTNSDFEIVPLVVPSRLDADDAADFLGLVDARNAIWRHLIGDDSMAFSAEDLLPRWSSQGADPIEGFVARVGGKVVGRSYASRPRDDVAPEGTVLVEVHPDFRRRGIGTALLEAALEASRRTGRRSLQNDFPSTAIPGAPTLAAPTGFGSIDRGDPGAEFAITHGFVLEQVARMSRLALPPDADVLRSALADARASAGGDYDLVWWLGETPDAWLADLANLRTRMKTDAPSAGLDVTEDPWDADRIRAQDRMRASSWHGALTVAARHIATGRLVAFSELTVPEDQAKVVAQNDTLVLAEHRGNALGLLMKAANLELLIEHFPGYPHVVTSNAEENVHMLAINERLGFVPWLYEGAWQRRL